MLVAARSSQDLACCARETESACSKYSSAFVASGSGNNSAISPAMRLISASNQLSLVVSILVIASRMQDSASSKLSSSARAPARYDKQNGSSAVAAVDRRAMIPEVITWTASETFPVRAKTQPWTSIPSDPQNKEPLSSARGTSSLASALAAA